MHRHIPLPHLHPQENASRLVRKCYMKSYHEYLFIFSRRHKYKFSTSEGFFGVFIPLLGITVPSKAENVGVKFLGNLLIRVEFLNFVII